jgi:hypothetical protein
MIPHDRLPPPGTRNGGLQGDKAGADKSCSFCHEPLGLGLEFIYQVEVAEFEQRYGVPLSLLTFIAERHDIPFSFISVVNESGEPMIVEGEPFRLCRECLASIEENRREIDEETAFQRGTKWLDYVGMGAVAVALLYVIVYGIVEWWITRNR